VGEVGCLMKRDCTPGNRGVFRQSQAGSTGTLPTCLNTDTQFNEGRLSTICNYINCNYQAPVNVGMSGNNEYPVLITRPLIKLGTHYYLIYFLRVILALSSVTAASHPRPTNVILFQIFLFITFEEFLCYIFTLKCCKLLSGLI